MFLFYIDRFDVCRLSGRATQNRLRDLFQIVGPNLCSHTQWINRIQKQKQERERERENRNSNLKPTEIE